MERSMLFLTVYCSVIILHIVQIADVFGAVCRFAYTAMR